MSAGFASNFPITVVVILFVVLLGLAIGLAFIPASIAKKKGYSKGGFWTFGFFAFLPALIVSLSIPPHPKKVVETIKGAIPNVNINVNSNVKYCPSCGTACAAESAFCTSCGNKF